MSPEPGLAILGPMDLPIAHLGHWYWYPLYAIPVVIVLVSAVLTALRERRSKDSAEGGEE